MQRAQHPVQETRLARWAAERGPQPVTQAPGIVALTGVDQSIEPDPAREAGLLRGVHGCTGIREKPGVQRLEGRIDCRLDETGGQITRHGIKLGLSPDGQIVADTKGSVQPAASQGSELRIRRDRDAVHRQPGQKPARLRHLGCDQIGRFEPKPCGRTVKQDRTARREQGDRPAIARNLNHRHNKGDPVDDDLAFVQKGGHADVLCCQ